MAKTYNAASDDSVGSGFSSKKGAKKSRPASTPADLLKRVPPHNVEAESAVLCGILTRSDLMNVIGDVLTPEDFYIPANQIIYNVFLELFSKSRPIDLVTTASMLKDRNELEAIGGTVYLGELAQAVVVGANAEYYAQIVRQKAMQRNLINVCSGIIGKCFDSNQEIETLLDEAEQDVFSVARRASHNEVSKSSDILEVVFDNLSRLAASKDDITGIPTGFKRLDELTSGLQNSDLIILAARPSVGKTAFAVCMSMNAAIKMEVPVAIFSLEMSKMDLMKRMLAVRGQVDFSRIRRPGLLSDEEWSAMHAAADVISKAPIVIDDTPAITTMELRTKARRLKAEYDIGLIVIDYLQLMRSSRRTDSRELEISDISRSLKSLAKELNIPIVALSQLNRKLEERTDKRPILADLRESGAIEQDADLIMFVHREDIYKYKKKSELPVIGEAEIIIGKQRNGPVGTVELQYNSPYTAFVDISYTAPSEALIE